KILPDLLKSKSRPSAKPLQDQTLAKLIVLEKRFSKWQKDFRQHYQKLEKSAAPDDQIWGKIFHQMHDSTEEAGVSGCLAQTLNVVRTGSLDNLNDTFTVANLLGKVCYDLQKLNNERTVRPMKKWQEEEDRWLDLQRDLSLLIKSHEKVERFIAWDDKAKAI